MSTKPLMNRPSFNFTVRLFIINLCTSRLHAIPNWYRALLYLLFVTFPCSQTFADLDLHKSTTVKSNQSSTRVILIHGLNHSPDNLKPLADELAKTGAKTTLLKLHGHTSSKDCGKRKNSPLSIWRKQIRNQISKAKEKRIILAGFSLGALVALDTLDNKRMHQAVSGVILFAPPVALTAKASTIRALLPLKLLGISIPSKAPIHSRVCKNTPLGFYSALFKLKDGLQTVTKSKLENIPGKIFISKSDELVDYRRVKLWAKTNKLKSWSIVTVDPKPSKSTRLPAHLLVDKKAIGSSAWEKLTLDCKKFINKTS